MERALHRLALLALACAGVAARAEQNQTGAREPLEPFAATPSLSRRSLIEAVLDRNPSLEAARLAWAAEREAVAQAAGLDDPTVSYTVAPLSIASSDAGAGQSVGVTQKLPFPGTWRLRAEAAEASATEAAQRVEEVRLRLATLASHLYDDYWLVDRALAITGDHIELLESFQRVATSRYATGLAPQQAPIQAEVEAAHLLHRQVLLRSERHKLVARLNALLHRTPGASLPPARNELELDPVSGIAAAEGPTRPELAAKRAQNEALRAQVGLATLQLKPDFQVTTSYNAMWGTPEHRWAVGFGLRLPLWRKKLHASVAEAEARLAAGESELAALADKVATELELALATLEETEHVVRLYRSRVLPAARDQVVAARTAFETGQSSMLSLIDAQRTLLDAELSHEEAVAAVATARAELDRTMGRMPFGVAGGPSRSATTSPRQGDAP